MMIALEINLASKQMAMKLEKYWVLGHFPYVRLKLYFVWKTALTCFWDRYDQSYHRCQQRNEIQHQIWWRRRRWTSRLSLFLNSNNSIISPQCLRRNPWMGSCWVKYPELHLRVSTSHESTRSCNHEWWRGNKNWLQTTKINIFFLLPQFLQHHWDFDGLFKSH